MYSNQWNFLLEISFIFPTNFKYRISIKIEISTLLYFTAFKRNLKAHNAYYRFFFSYFVKSTSKAYPKKYFLLLEWQVIFVIQIIEVFPNGYTMQGSVMGPYFRLKFKITLFYYFMFTKYYTFAMNCLWTS